MIAIPSPQVRVQEEQFSVQSSKSTSATSRGGIGELVPKVAIPR
jgi:hypothetical protein